jgi:type IV pilus assembly protein PilV
MNHSLRNERGFLLIEVLIGLIFLAIGLLGIGCLQVASVRGNSSGNNVMQATYVAQDRLELLKFLPFDSTQLQTGNHDDGNTNISGLIFNRAYTVADNGGLKTIKYAVTWNDGVDHNISFSTNRSQ